MFRVARSVTKKIDGAPDFTEQGMQEDGNASMEA